MELIAYLLPESFATVASEAMGMLLSFFLPFVAFALAIHWFERITQRRLAERFGWNAVLWTGWLGTPIHELSHVLACYLFRHRVDEVVFFEPDRESGRLGYVRHSYRHDNWFQRLGNVFIGIAPLVGGSIVLTLLLWLFYPQAIEAGYQASVRPETLEDIFQQVGTMTAAIGGELFQANHWVTFRFWLFLYLVLCVGSHMAPSGSDYQGATRGAVIAVISLFGVTLLLAAAGFPLNQAFSTFLIATGPLFAILTLVVFLCGVTTLIVFLITGLFDRNPG